MTSKKPSKSPWPWARLAKCMPIRINREQKPENIHLLSKHENEVQTITFDPCGKGWGKGEGSRKSQQGPNKHKTRRNPLEGGKKLRRVERERGVKLLFFLSKQISCCFWKNLIAFTGLRNSNKSGPSTTWSAFDPLFPESQHFVLWHSAQRKEPSTKPSRRKSPETKLQSQN